MKRIHFNEETISQIRNFLEDGHTVKEACNRFTLKYDTMKRVMTENHIVPNRTPSGVSRDARCRDSETVNLVCGLFRNTDTPVNQIVKTAKLEYYQVLGILKDNFTEKEINDRKSRLYRNSKLSTNNPNFGKTREEHNRFKGGIVSDGAGYLMCKKPDWYTGRKGSDYVFYHSIVICEALGLTEIPKGFCVHHIDGNPQNNEISNLALMSIGAHSKLHNMYNKMCKEQRLSEQE